VDGVRRTGTTRTGGVPCDATVALAAFQRFSLRGIAMKRLLILSALALTGCVNPPIQGRADPYGPSQVMFDSTALRNDTAIGQPIVSRDQFNLLRVTLPIRSAISKQLYVQYRVTFFDMNHTVLEQQSWMTRTLTANTPDQIDVHSTSNQAVDFQIDLRYPPGY
jgi:uncharacterized protein YcfL